MNVVSLVNNAEKYLGQKVTVTGILDRPRKKHSSYVFFNVASENGNLVQVVVKKDLLGKERFKELTYGLAHKDIVTVTGSFDLRSSDRTDFADYEITAEAISKEVG
jgi:aspartyl-tRNA synthetase